MPDPRITFLLTARDNATKTIGRLNKSVGVLRNSFSGLGVSLAGALSVAGLVSFTRRTLDAADNLGKLNKQLGISVEELSRYQFVASQTGVEFNTFTTALQRLGRRTAEAAQGTGEARKALEELNLSAQKLSVLSIDKQFEIIAEAIKEVRNPTDRLRLAFKFFDTEGVRLLRTIESGADGIRALKNESDALGRTLTAETAQAAEDANDALDRLAKSTESFGLALISTAAPAIISFTDTLDGFKKSLNDARQAAEALAPIGADISALSDVQAVTRLADLTRQIETLEQVLDTAGTEGVGFDPFGFKDAGLQETRNQLVLLRVEFERVQESRRKSLRNQGAGAATSLADVTGADPSRPRAGGATPRAARTSPAENLIKSLERQAKQIQLSEEGFLKYELAIAKATPAQTQQALAIFESKQRLEEFNEELKKTDTLNEDAARAAKEYSEQLKEQGEELEKQLFPQAEAAERLAKIQELLDAGAISETVYIKARDDVVEFLNELNKVDEALQQNNKFAEEFGLAFASAGEEALVNFTSVREVLKGLEEDLFRIATKNLFTKPFGDFATDLVGDISGGGTGGGGFFSDIFGSLFGGARQSGGPVSAGKAFLVGESGPELFIPSGSGEIVANQQAGGATVVQNFNIPSAEVATFQKNRGQIARAARQALQGI